MPYPFTQTPQAPLGFQTPMPGPQMNAVPPPMSLPPGANPPSMNEVPPEMDQNRVIQQILAMLDSPDPQTRVMGQQLVDKFARTPMGAFLNRLTQGNPLAPRGTPGYSDQLMTMEPGQQQPGRFVGKYTPEAMAYGDKLGREVPGLGEDIGTAEAVGTGANVGGLALLGRLAGRSLGLGGGGPALPRLPMPMSPAGGSPTPPGTPQQPPGSPLEPPPGWLQRQGRGLGLPPGAGMSPEPGPPPMPPEDTTGLPPGFPKALGREPSLGSPKEVGPRGQEGIYNREMDKGLPGAEGKAPTKSELKKLKLTPAQRKILGLD